MLTYDHVKSGILSETRPHVFTAFASDLLGAGFNFAPGNWPLELPASLGNKQPLFPISKVVRDGEIKYVRYGQGNGCIQIIVYND